jgi:dipeptidyl aminopeptidase/acylaminoacyl peptidase
MYQTVDDLPNGKYKMDIQGFFRMGGGANDAVAAAAARQAGNEQLNAIYYFNEKEEPLMSIFDSDLTHSNNSTYNTSSAVTINGVNYYVPNDRTRAGKCFEAGEYVNKSFTASNGVKIDYYVYVPKNIDSEEELPLHLFLWPTRSQGPQGYFNVHGLPALLRNGQDASGVVICPKLGADEKYTNSKMKALKELMDSYVKEYNLDENRISVSGQGGGGQAAINIATKYPNYFSKVAGLYSSAATSDYTKFASSKEEAENNIANNSILLIKSRGGGDYLNERSENYTNKIYNELKKYNNIDVIKNPDLGDLYGSSLYKKEFTYDGKTYTNFLEYMFAQTKN